MVVIVGTTPKRLLRLGAKARPGSESSVTAQWEHKGFPGELGRSENVLCLEDGQDSDWPSTYCRTKVKESRWLLHLHAIEPS